MTIAEVLLSDFDHEFATTRTYLERVPEDKFDYKPHEKSMAMGQLASHLAEAPGWAVVTVNDDVMDFNPPDGKKWEPFIAKTKAEMLAKFDESVAAAKQAIASCSDEKMGAMWTMLNSGQEVMKMPRLAVLKAFVLSHNTHHRAQLGVYFRLNDIPVPMAYGPTADEGQM